MPSGRASSPTFTPDLLSPGNALPYTSGTWNDNIYPGLTLADSSVVYLKNSLRSYKHELVLDSLRQWVQIRETVLGEDIRIPRVIGFEDYKKERIRDETYALYADVSMAELGKTIKDRRGPGGIAIDIPVHIKSKAFQRIFGGSTVGLNVTGDITIKGALRHEDRSQIRDALTRGSNYNFKMEQTQRFKVTGRVGEKVTVDVDQDSERPFDFDNSIKLKYDGDDDEIITSIEAGNVGLSLPGTRFVTFSGKNAGLFGIKANMNVGNLKMTTIASQEKGEKKKLELSGGAKEGSQQFNDYQFVRGRYFFLDTYYREQYKNIDENGNHVYDPSRVITDIEIYKSEARYDLQTGSVFGWGVLDPNQQPPDTLEVTRSNHHGYWLRMEKSEYFFQPELGYLRFHNSFQSGQVLAVAYRDSSGNVYGNLTFDPETQSVIMLKLIKTEEALPSDPTADLEWRHVYSLGGRNIQEDGFDLKIYFKPPSGDLQETVDITVGSKKHTLSYLTVFGLDRADQDGNPTPDGIIDFNDNFLNLGTGELIFPDLRPFDPEGFQVVIDGDIIKLPEEFRTPAIYDTNVTSVIQGQSKFVIEIKSSNKSANYQLGFNVIEGSEEVRLNGRVLNKDKDYVIDYFSGSLTILNEEATASSADVDITYESNELFQLDKKTLLGMRAEYQFLENSFIGGTFLYLNQRTLDTKIRVGKGPMRNMIWDLNTALDFNPNFLTSALDALPFVETQQPSRLKFEGEMAQVLPNPNTVNNEATGDNSGVAYIDDFEGSKKTTPLGVLRSTWKLGSAPVQKTGNLLARGRLIWYNPYQQVYVKEIWPDRDVNANASVPQNVHVLSLSFTPGPEYGAESWGSLLRPLSTGFSDQTESKFLEIWVDGDEGRLHIDLGQITEDVIPNNKLDTEDIRRNGIRNDLLDPGEDVGLDGQSGPDPPDYPHDHDPDAPYDYWDIDADGEKDPNEPWSYDDWRYEEQSSNYDQINGTEKNERDPNSGGRPDSEDINRNGALDRRNDYFEYTFSLDKTHPDTALIAGGRGNEHGWRMYRIPLAEPDTVVGNPQISLIEFARIWVDGVEDNEAFIRIAEINLVGSEWKELGVAVSDSSEYVATDDSTVVVTTINTHDNPEYKPPPGVQGAVDRITQIQAKEQTLVMRVNNLAPDASGIIQKTFFQAQSYINYNRMKMYVYGYALGSDIQPDTSTVEFFFRFGSDLRNYYEIRSKVYFRWDKDNHLDVDLNKLAAIKFQEVTPGDTVEVVQPDGKVWRKVGRPALTNVRMLVAGVKNVGDQFFTGEVWINELRLSEVKKDVGYAMRASFNLELADVARFNGQIHRQDADFHNVNTRFGTGNNALRGNLAGSVSLGKFLPKSWGLNIPLSFTASENLTTPKYVPGSDILVTKETTPDSVMEKIQTRQQQRGFNVSFGRRSKSRNFFIKNTIDAVSVKFGQTFGDGSNSTQVYNRSRGSNGSVSYSLRFSRKANFRPMGWLGEAPIVRKVSGIRFYPLPSSLSLSANGNESKTSTLTRSGLSSERRVFNVTRNAKIAFKPFDSMNLDFGRNYTSDMRNSDKKDMLKGRFGENTSVNQNFQARYTPALVSFISNNFSYTANYKWSNPIQQRTQGQRASVNANVQANVQLIPKKLMSALGIKSKKGGSSRRRRTRPRPNQKKDKKKDEGKGKEKKKKSGPGGGFSILRGLDQVVGRLQNISVTYSQRNNTNAFALDGAPSFAYMIGRTKDPGVGKVAGIADRSSDTENQTLSIQSGLNITRTFTITFKYNTSQNANFTTTPTGSFSESRWNKGDVSAPFPEWTVRWSGFEKLPFFKGRAQSVSLDHGYTGQFSSTWNTSESNVTREEFRRDFRPLVGMNIRWKFGMTTNFRLNQSETITLNKAGGLGRSRVQQSDISITSSYSKSTGFRLPFPGLKNKVLKNNVDFSFTYTKSLNANAQSQTLESPFEETRRTLRWSAKPQVTYSFNTRVRGGAFFEIGKNSNQLYGDTTIKEFGIDVRIAIRGN